MAVLGCRSWDLGLFTLFTGRPEDGLAAGTRWGDIPESWACPDCGVAKADFEVVEI